MNKFYKIEDDNQILKTDLICNMLRFNNPESLIGFSYRLCNENINSENLCNVASDFNGNDLGYQNDAKSDDKYLDFNYKVEGLISIKEYLKRKIMSENKIINLFLNLLSVENATKNLYIEPKNLSWCVDDIYIDTSNDTLKFLYTPLCCQQSLEKSMEMCFKELIYNYINAEQGVSNVLKIVMSYITEVGWHIKGLHYKLMEIKENRENKENYISNQNKDNFKIEQTYQINDLTDVSQNHLIEKNISDKKLNFSRKNIDKNKFCINDENDDLCMDDELCNDVNSSGSDDIFGSQDLSENIFDVQKLYGGKNKKSKGKIVFIYMILAIIMGIALSVLWILPFSNIQKIGAMLIVGSIASMIYKKFKYDKKESNGYKITENKGIKNETENKKFRNNNSEIAIGNKKSINEEGKIRNKFIRKHSNFDENNLSKSNLNKNDLSKNNFINDDKYRLKTMFISQTVGRCFLKSANGNEIHLVKERIIVGRDKESVDICIDGNINVGRHHAELIRIKSGYAIKDLKSINGTYVGDLKVKPTESIALFNGDRVKFANVEYIYHNWSA